MNRPKGLPLSYGEYVSPQAKTSTQTWSARLALITTVRRIFPTLLRKLAYEVLPVYSQTVRDGYKVEAILWSTRSPYQLLKHDGGLKAALTDWAAGYHADAEWLLDGALRTLRLWNASPEARARLEWYTAQTFSDRAADVPRFEFSCAGWRTELTTWRAYRDAVRKDLEEKLLEYEKKSREFAESRGLIRAQRQYSPDNLEWFVLYQFAGLSSKKIADRHAAKRMPVDDSTVLKGIKKAARLIGWEQLRGVRPVRDRKTR